MVLKEYEINQVQISEVWLYLIMQVVFLALVNHVCKNKL